jgi:hypothetical protein
VVVSVLSETLRNKNNSQKKSASADPWETWNEIELWAHVEAGDQKNQLEMNLKRQECL